MKKASQMALIMTMAGNYRQSFALFAAAELKLFSILYGRELDVNAIADACSGSPHRLRSLLDLLCFYGFLHKSGGLYALHPEISPLCDPQARDNLENRLAHPLRTARSWFQIARSIKEDLPVRKLPQAPERNNAEHIQAFHTSLGINSYNFMKQLRDQLDLPQGLRVLDVGGGFGDMCRPLLEADENASAVVLDTPDTAELAAQQARNVDLTGRLEFVGCDFIHDDIPGGFDLVILSSILHIYDPDTILQLLAKLHKALRAGGRILVREIDIDSERTGPEAGLQFALHMALNTDAGDAWPAADIMQWLHGAGFNSATLIESMSEHGVFITASKHAGKALPASNDIA